MQWVNTWRSLLFLQKIKDFFLSLKNMHLKFENPRRNCSPSFHRQSIKEHRKEICYQSMMPVERIKSTPSEIYENSAFSSYRICNFRRKTHFPGINQKVNGCRCLFVKFFWDFFLSDKLIWIGGNTPLHLERISICKHVILRRKKSQVLYQPN